MESSRRHEHDLCAIWVSTLCRPCHFCIVQCHVTFVQCRLADCSLTLSRVKSGDLNPRNQHQLTLFPLASMNMIAVLRLHLYSSTKQHLRILSRPSGTLSNVTYVPPTFCTCVSILLQRDIAASNTTGAASSLVYHTLQLDTTPLKQTDPTKSRRQGCYTTDLPLLTSTVHYLTKVLQLGGTASLQETRLVSLYAQMR